MNDDTTDEGVETLPDGSILTNGAVSRRRLVAAGAAGWLSVGLAGCSRDGTGGSGDGGDGTVTVTNRTTATEPVTEDTASDDDDSTAASTETAAETSTETAAPTPSPTPTPTPTPTPAGTTCPSSLVFERGSSVGFLVGIYRSETGTVYGSEDVDSVHVRFPNDDIPPRELIWDGPHAEHVDDRWGGKLAETENLDPGDYHYEVVVTSDGGERRVQTGQFKLRDAED